MSYSSSRPLRIATRKSLLALWQAEYVKAELEKHHPGLLVELVPLTSRGDKILDVPLAKVGGKGLFVKELETALLEDDADIAVHSMKDVPMDFPAGLGLSVICPREDARDAFVSNRFNSLDELPQGAVVGTSSLRRQCQLLANRPDLEIKFLRGNVQTRLQKLDDGEYDAIILAAAGLIRLELKERIRDYIAPEQVRREGVDVPAVDTVLMLRPTESPTLFLQQLGRGLRRSPGKGFCTAKVLGRSSSGVPSRKLT